MKDKFTASPEVKLLQHRQDPSHYENLIYHLHMYHPCSYYYFCAIHRLQFLVCTMEWKTNWIKNRKSKKGMWRKYKREKNSNESENTWETWVRWAGKRGGIGVEREKQRTGRRVKGEAAAKRRRTSLRTMQYFQSLTYCAWERLEQRPDLQSAQH